MSSLNLPTSPVVSIDPRSRTNEFGASVTMGGVITVDIPFTQLGDTSNISRVSKDIMIGTGGDLFIRGVDGLVIPYFGIPSGKLLPIKGTLVYSSVTVGATTFTTTATDMTWHGGA